MGQSKRGLYQQPNRQPTAFPSYAETMETDMKYDLGIFRVCLSAVTLFSIQLSSAVPSGDTINRLEAVLASLSSYSYGDPETWRPELIEVMRNVYQLPDTQTHATTLMLDFLNSGASSEAKKAVRFNYYSLVDRVVPQSNNQDWDELLPPSSLMIKVADLNKDFEKSKKPVAYVKQTLKTASNELRPHAIRLVRDLPDTFRKGSTLFKINSLNSHNKAQLLRILAARKDSSIHDLAIHFAQDEDSMLRMAGLISLQTIGKAEATRFLTEMAVSWNDPEKTLARNALYRMPGRDVDAAISRLLMETASTEGQMELISAIEKRSIQSATGQLLELASQEGKTQSQAIRAIALIAPLNSLDAVIDLLTESDTSKQKRALETAIYRIAYRFADDPVASTTIRERILASEDRSLKDSLSSILEKLSN